MVGVMILFQKDLCQHAAAPRTIVVSASGSMAGHRQPVPLLETAGHSQASLAVFYGVTVPFSWVLMLTSFCLCPSRVSVSPVLWKFCNQILLAFKVNFPGGLLSLCWIARLGNLLFTLELSQQCENFFGIIVLQFVSHLLSSFIVGLPRWH